MLPFTAIHEVSGTSVSYGREESAESDDFSIAELMIMDNLKKADSKNHIKGLGQRIVRSSPKRSYGDPLLTRFLNKSSQQTQNHDATLIDRFLIKSDSKRHINGRGRRVVKTRNTKNSHTSGVLMEMLLLNKSETSKEDDGIKNISKQLDGKNHVSGRGPRIDGTLPKKNPGCDPIARCA
jgi:hypothetical protein